MAQAVLDFSRTSGKSRAVGARRRNGLAMRTLAWQARWRGDFDNAESFSHRAIARLKGEGAEAAIADCSVTLAMVHCSRGRRDLARECIEQGRDALAHQPNASTRIDLLIGQATIERYGRRMSGAQEAMLEALAISAGAERARTEQSVARSLLSDDLPGEALEHAKTAIAEARQHQNRVILPYAIEVAAAALIDLGRLDQARPLLREGETLARQSGDRRAACHLLYYAVRLKEGEGDHETALTLSRQGQDTAGVIGYPLWLTRFLERTAQLEEDLGHTQAALDTLKRLIALREAERG